MNVKKELASNKTVLLIMPGIEYNETILDVLRQLAGKSICYVTLNKTFDSLKELFEKNGINISNIVFIDAISKTIKSVPSQTKNCYFCSYPGALTEISLAISKFLRHNFEYLIFDSLTNLLIYQKKAPVAQFLSNLANKIRDSNTKAVFYALSVKEQDEIIKEAEMFVDDVVEIKE
jgi:KaiC/GvpD/RAD55 family RecA-like ATPase